MRSEEKTCIGCAKKSVVTQIPKTKLWNCPSGEVWNGNRCHRCFLDRKSFLQNRNKILSQKHINGAKQLGPSLAPQPKLRKCNRCGILNKNYYHCSECLVHIVKFSEIEEAAVYF